MVKVKREAGAKNDDRRRKECKFEKINSRSQKACWEKTESSCNSLRLERHWGGSIKTWGINQDDWSWGKKIDKSYRKINKWNGEWIQIKNGNFRRSKNQIEQNWVIIYQDLWWNSRETIIEK